MVEENDYIGIIEVALRDVIHDKLTEQFGFNWVNNPEASLDTSTYKWSASLRKKAENELRALGIGVIADLPIAYTEFSHLSLLLKKHEQLFKDVFPDFQKTLVYIDTCHQLRNTVKHHRPIAPSQKQLLAGIAGELLTDINLWRIGTRADVLSTKVLFRDHVITDGKTHDQILEESRDRIESYEKLWLVTLEDAGFKNNEISCKKQNDYKTEIYAPHTSVTIYTTDKSNSNCTLDEKNAKYVIMALTVRCDSKISIGNILEQSSLSYGRIEYMLDSEIDISLLIEWSKNQAGLSPGSSVAVNGTYTQASYGFLNGQLRMEARNAKHGSTQKGILALDFEKSGKSWSPHLVITAQHLLGFALGNISSRTMMYMHNKSIELATEQRLASLSC